MPISIQQISYIHPDKEVLFSDLNFAISKGQKLGLVGNNGCGKSTLLQIIAGQLAPSSGVIVRPDDLYYIPQHFGQYINGKTNCSTFTKHFVPNLILLTQNKMCILLRWFHLFTSFVYLCISLA